MNAYGFFVLPTVVLFSGVALIALYLVLHDLDPWP